MSVDLRSSTAFGQISLVLMDDCVVKLEHSYTEDRIRKYLYDSIESVVIWRKIPFVRLILCLVVLILPGVGCFFVSQTPATVCGIILCSIGVPLVLWYLYCQKTTIQIVRDGTPHNLVGIFRPGKVRSFRDRLINAIRAYQATLAGAASEVSYPATEPGESVTPFETM